MFQKETNRRAALALIGTPYEELNCWELVHALYDAQGITLRHYTEYAMSHEEEWEEVTVPSLGDVLVFAMKGKQCDHVGLYMGNGYVIHAREGVGVCLEPLGRYAKLIRGIYRYKEGIA